MKIAVFPIISEKSVCVSKKYKKRLGKRTFFEPYFLYKMDIKSWLRTVLQHASIELSQYDTKLDTDY